MCSGKNPRPAGNPADIWEELRTIVRHGYPNPERIGCPSEEILRKLALAVTSFRLDDSVVDHVAHCSPCFEWIEQLRSQDSR